MNQVFTISDAVLLRQILEYCATGKHSSSNQHYRTMGEILVFTLKTQTHDKTGVLNIIVNTTAVM